ncbi:MAG TPA: phosphoribosylglycinamide synthetase C domain-containing protein, partial [Acidobacteriaceae bacterium]|nr:phosphoribosylglycinamide synthetase C domain-containing protein [Acidobacteriaceae bacterium]
EACVQGRLSDAEFRWKPGASACVVAASGGYPGSYTNGYKISGLEEAAKVPGVVVFHAGTSLADGDVLTSGGRVLAVTATGENLRQALSRAYEGIEKIAFEGMYYRRDIGRRALAK